MKLVHKRSFSLSALHIVRFGTYCGQLVVTGADPGFWKGMYTAQKSGNSLLFYVWTKIYNVKKPKVGLEWGSI